MEYFPAPLENLVDAFESLPGIGHKSAQRLAYHVLAEPEEEAKRLADAILDRNGPTTRLIVNHIPGSGFSNTGVRDLDECIDTVCVQLIGAVPDSPLIARAAVSGQALAPGSTAFRAVDNIAARLLGEMPPLALR